MNSKQCVFMLMAMVLVACAPVATTPDPSPSYPSPAPAAEVHFTAERLSAGVIRLALDNGDSSPIGYSLCPSELQRWSGSAWTPVESGEVCTMQWMTLNPGHDATFEKRLPANLPSGQYRYVTSIERPLGSTRVLLATSPFTV